MPDSATLEIDGRVATLTMDRAEKRNALSRGLIASLREHVETLRPHEDVSVVVLRGGGGTFCAGMDLKAVLGEPGAPFELLSGIAELSIGLRTLPQVVIADVRGAAIGGGCGLMAVCDIAVTHPDAKLGFPEVDLGVCPAVVAPWLVRSIGGGRARRVLLQGGTMNGVRAFELGMVSALAGKDELDAWVAETAGRLAKAGPHALAATKGLLNHLEEEATYDAVRKGARLSADVIAGDEAQERLGKLYGG